MLLPVVLQGAVVTLIGIGRRAKNSRPGRMLALALLVMLWDAAVFALVRCAGELAALTNATIYVCHASQEFFLAWIILHEPFLALRVRSYAVCSAAAFLLLLLFEYE